MHGQQSGQRAEHRTDESDVRQAPLPRTGNAVPPSESEASLGDFTIVKAKSMKRLNMRSSGSTGHSGLPSVRKGAGLLAPSQRKQSAAPSTPSPLLSTPQIDVHSSSSKMASPVEISIASIAEAEFSGVATAPPLHASI